jgi:hypothetical protein
MERRDGRPGLIALCRILVPRQQDYVAFWSQFFRRAARGYYVLHGAFTKKNMDMKSLITACVILIAAGLSPRAEAVTLPYVLEQPADLAAGVAPLHVDPADTGRHDTMADLPALPLWLLVSGLGALGLWRGTRGPRGRPGADGLG